MRQKEATGQAVARPRHEGKRAALPCHGPRATVKAQTVISVHF
jgi:hypothetical protein